MAQIYISLGSNIEPIKHVNFALTELKAQFGTLMLSKVYQSQSVGFDGDDFYNMVIGIKSDLSAFQVNEYLKTIEKKAGRKSSLKKFASRTLDLDILNYDDLILETPILLPRAEILFNAFVLQPLNDIAPNWKHPVKNKTIKELWQHFDKSSQRLNVIADPFERNLYEP